MSSVAVGDAECFVWPAFPEMQAGPCGGIPWAEAIQRGWICCGLQKRFWDRNEQEAGMATQLKTFEDICKVWQPI